MNSIDFLGLECVAIVLCQKAVSTFSCRRYPLPIIPSVLIEKSEFTTWKVILNFINSLFTMPMVEIILYVILVISIASFYSTSRSSSKASNLITFVSAPVSTKDLAFDRKSSFDESSTTGGCRLSLVQKIFLVSWEISRWSDAVSSSCPSPHLFAEQSRSLNHFYWLALVIVLSGRYWFLYRGNYY